MAVCFGHAHIPLNLDAFEDQFGLRVTLNTVPRGNLRTMDLASHLWMQGIVSAQAFISDNKFRGDLRKKVKALKPGFESYLPMANQEPVRKDYEIIFGVMRQRYRDGTIGLPFFSKVSLRAAAENLQQMGFPVSLHLIEKDGALEEEELQEAA